MTFVQYVFLFLCALGVVNALRHLRRRHLSRSVSLGWLLFWMAAGVVVVLPQTTDRVARLVGVGRGVDVAMYISLLFLFALVFRLFLKLEQMERSLTRLVRDEALERAQQEQPFL